MKALRFSKFGLPSVLRIEEIPRPEPRDGEALVKVKAAAINPSDVKNVAGRFSGTTLPRTPGRDFSGVVIAGTKYENAEVWSSGPGLGVTRDGAQAEYVTVPEEALSLKPRALSLEQAATIGVPFITAWFALVRAAQLEPGETILIIGVNGAVGQAAMQIAKSVPRRGPVCANKIKGVRACLIEDHFSAKQGVEDDNLNVICLGGRIEGPELAWDLVQTFLAAKFTQADRHLRRLRKVAALETQNDYAKTIGREL